MPSEQRLHPATLLFDVARHLKNFAVPALLVAFGTSRSSGGLGGTFGGLPSGWEVLLLVLFVPAVLASVSRYLTFRLRYDERELVIRWGFFFRNERHVPFSRIQNVDAIQNFFHRLLGVVEVRVETGGGKEEEARLSVLPRAALDDIRRHVFQERDEAADSSASQGEAEARGHTLVHLPLRELLLCGFLENRGMVVIGAAFGVAWETGVLGPVTGRFFEDNPLGQGFVRDLIGAIVDDGSLPLPEVGMVLAAVLCFLLLVRVVSMVWALVRLYDFRLTQVNEDLRSEYGLITRVAATVPTRRVQTIVVRAGPVHRWLHRASVRVETAGGAGAQGATKVREWLAPLIRVDALPQLLQQVLPGFDFTAVVWSPVHSRAFQRAIKAPLIATAALTLIAVQAVGWAALGVLAVSLLWSFVATRQHVAHLGWVEGDEVVMMKSGWIWRQVTVARINKIQVVATHQSPFDRRAGMARVRVDTAGASDLSHRVDIPYLDQQVADGLAARLSAAAANTAFRW